ncbi:pali-domain-containing protein [Ceraceosorus guamensis]|uniref:Pali-domain-containing protein n=1 Tax=Ceraceosorus guamensis TaxID=1522189 RepID=A0A316W7B1_9BASI|nr:pali-domain-containing protein [Ceraceosorus guamensis]PWN45702.1 pali-domain-containing protein [Ceraceosorus guamensis]
MRSGLPGTVLVLAAVICLALATCSTPVIKSLSFLDATASGSNRHIRLGTLGACVGNTCSSPRLGYSFDSDIFDVPNLVPENWSSTVIKGLTYTLILHPVALAASLIVLVFGLFSLCRTYSTGCCSSLFAGFAAGITVLAFGLDCALFIIAKKRIESTGGSASLGAALWLTLAAWVCLFLSTCAFGCGACCGGKGGRKDKLKDSYGQPGPNGGFVGDNYGERMRMDALRAEQDRQRRQELAGSDSLPKFAVYEQEIEEEQPLKQHQDSSHANGYGYQPYPQQQHQFHDPYSGYGNQHGYVSNEPTHAYAQPNAHSSAPRGDFSDVPNPGMAGYGAHSTPPPQRAPSLAAASHYQEPTYTPGVGPQPYRDGLERDGSMSHALAAGAAAGAASYAAYESTRRQPTMDDAGYTSAWPNAQHPNEGTFGGMPDRAGSTVSYRDPSNTYGASDAQAEAQYGHAVSPSRDQNYYAAGASTGRSPSRVQGSRRLPTIPVGDDKRQASGTAGDDGFGLAVLQAGAAAKSQTSHAHAPSHLTDFDMVTSPASAHDDAHRAAVEAAYAQHHAQHHQNQREAEADPYGGYDAAGTYTSAQHGDAYEGHQDGGHGPPGYESAYHQDSHAAPGQHQSNAHAAYSHQNAYNDGYGGRGQQQYGQEKRY